jgi:hypothetical protein
MVPGASCNTPASNNCSTSSNCISTTSSGA